MSTISPDDKHLMRLIIKGRDSEGWAKVSSAVAPLMKNLPPELVELDLTEDGGRARLTQNGETVLEWT